MSDTKFKSGESENPLGRPKGSKDKRTQHRELFNSRAPEILKKAIELALAGDTACLKMCLDRIVPSYRPQEVGIELGDIADSLSDQSRLVIVEMLKGNLTAIESSRMLTTLESQVKIAEQEEEKNKWAFLK
jgi:hypothetical protein|tara:strand:+ start:1175 stop:1567 length:393 start_codon:yes stop_codon:yes gene_type:complete